MTASTARRARRIIAGLWVMAGLGCAGTTPATEHPTVSVQADSVSAPGLTGVWAEYWSPAGQAETQRYTFVHGGEFRWSAAPSVSAPTAGTPIHKVGQYEVRHADRRSWLVLHVAMTQLAGCDSACDAAQSSPFRVEHNPPLLEEIELGQCPPNAEAQRIDTQYACLALGPDPFWRRPEPASR